MHDHFLKLICANPADIGPRLVYADWLEEQGDPRGEFIRVQCALDGMTKDNPQYESLRQRERLLLGQHQKEWLRPLEQLLGPNEPRQPAAAVTGWLGSLLPRTISRAIRGVAAVTFPIWKPKFSNGFVEMLEITYDHLNTIGTTIPSTIPLRRLEVSPGRIVTNDAWAWMTNDLMRHVESLKAWTPISAEPNWQEIWQSLQSPSLRHLSVIAEPANVITQIAQGLVGQQLISLELALGPINSSEIGRLSDLRQLTCLSLDYIDLDANAFSDLARQPVCNRLKELNLTSCSIGNAVMYGLEAARFGALTKLRLDRSEIGDSGAEFLAQNILLRQLSSIHLSHNQLSDRGAMALADSPHFQGRTTLYLQGNPISPDVRRALKIRFGDRILVDDP